MSIFTNSINRIQNVAPAGNVIPVNSSIRNYFKSTGVTSDEAALRLSAYFGGIQMVSSNIASLDSQIIRESDDGNREIKASHRLHNLLKYQPNAYTTSYKFHKFLVVSMMLRGNGFARIERGPNGSDVIALHQERPRDVEIYENPDTNELFYKFKGQKGEYRSTDVIHIFNFSRNGISGDSYLEAGARKQFGSHLSVQEFNQRFFENNSFLGGVLKTTDSLGSDPGVVESAKSEIRQEWEQRFSGSSNAGSVPILEGNWDFEEISMSMKDAQLIERSEFTVKEIARILNIPLSLMGIEGANSYNSAESDSKIYRQNAIQPIIKILTEEYRSKLFKEREKKNGYAVSIPTQDVELVTFSDKAEGIKSLVLAGILTLNEARKEFGKDTLENMDINTIQKNVSVLKDGEVVQDDSSGNSESVNVL